MEVEAVSIEIEACRRLRCVALRFVSFRFVALRCVPSHGVIALVSGIEPRGWSLLARLEDWNGWKAGTAGSAGGAAV